MELDDTFIVVATILSFLLCASLFLSVSRQIFSFSFPLFFPLLFLAEAAFTVSPPLALSLSLFLSVCSFYINHITVSHQKRSRKTKPLEEPKQQRMETTQSEWKRKNDTYTHTKQPNHRVEMKRNVYIFAHFERDSFCSVKNADMQCNWLNQIVCVCVREMVGRYWAVANSWTNCHTQCKQTVMCYVPVTFNWIENHWFSYFT